MTLILSAVGLHEGGKFLYNVKAVLQFLRSRMCADDIMLLGRYIAVDGDAQEKEKEVIASINSRICPSICLV